MNFHRTSIQENQQMGILLSKRQTVAAPHTALFFVMIFLMWVALPAAEAVVILNGSAASGEIVGVSGNDAATMQYDNQGDLLAAIITISSNGNIASTVDPTVSYNGKSLTREVSGRRRGNGMSLIYYVTDPATDENTFSVDFGSSILPDGGGAWEFGVFSLSNIDETAPIASSEGWDRNSTRTLDSDFPGAIDNLDLVLIGSAAEYEHPDPHWTVSTDSQSSLFYNNSPTGAGRHEYNGIYAFIADGDLSGTNNDELILTQNNESRLGGYSAVVFNGIIPEPTSLALLVVGGLLGIVRRPS